MNSHTPWSIKGIDPEARSVAKDAAKRAGVTLGEWMNSVIKESGQEDKNPSSRDADEPLHPPGQDVGNVTALSAAPVTLEQLKELVLSLNRMNERLKVNEARSKAAVTGLTEALPSVLERIRRVEEKSRNENDENVLERLETIEENQNTPLQRDNLVALENSLQHVVHQFETTQAQTLGRMQANEQVVSSLAARFDDLDAQSTQRFDGLRHALKEMAEQINRTDSSAAAVLSEAEEAAQSSDAEFIERTSHKLQILGNEIKRTGDDMQRLEQNIEKLAGKIEAAETRSAEGITRVAQKVDSLRTDTSVFDAGHVGQKRMQAETALNEVRQNAQKQVATLNDSFDTMKAILDRQGEDQVGEEDPFDRLNQLGASGQDADIEEIVDSYAGPDHHEHTSDSDPALNSREKIALAAQARRQQLAANPTDSTLENDANLLAAADEENYGSSEHASETHVLSERADLSKRLQTAQTVQENEEKSRFRIMPAIIGIAVFVGIILLGGISWLLFMDGEKTGDLQATAIPEVRTPTVPTDAQTIKTVLPNARAGYDRALAAVESANTAEERQRAFDMMRQVATAFDFAPAMHELGTLYLEGRGVDANVEVARQWFNVAADAGNVKAMHALGHLAANAGGGIESDKATLGWFEKAANMGYVNSMFNLGTLYNPAEKLLAATMLDAGESYYWYSLAYKAGDTTVALPRDSVRALLSLEDITRIDNRVAAWQIVSPSPDANAL